MSIIDKVKNYFIGSYAEMRKVTWPTKQQTINYSLIVISLSVGIAVFFMVMDYIFSYGINLIINR